MKHYLKLLNVGPGGIRCRCCFPPAGKRRKAFRRIRRVLKRETQLLVTDAAG